MISSLTLVCLLFGNVDHNHSGALEIIVDLRDMVSIADKKYKSILAIQVDKG